MLNGIDLTVRSFSQSYSRILEFLEAFVLDWRGGTRTLRGALALGFGHVDVDVDNLVGRRSV